MGKKDKRSAARQLEMQQRHDNKKWRKLIVMAPNPILQTVCGPVDLEKGLAEAVHVGETLVAVCQATDTGVGMAAPQIGKTSRVIMIWPERHLAGEYRIMINPEILGHSEEVKSAQEGCLSYPGRNVWVTRWEWVDILYHGSTGPNKIRLEGFAARVFQHEMDHLDGKCPLEITQPDRVLKAPAMEKKGSAGLRGPSEAAMLLSAMAYGGGRR